MTMTTTAEISQELEEHVFNLNEEALAWMKAAPEGSFRGAAIYDDKDIMDAIKYHGVETPADWDALRAWEDYYDVYKDYNGISPRWTKWSEHTAEEWDQKIKNL